MDERYGFSFREVTAVLADMFGIDPSKHATFSARLQQLQRIGLPRGANPGRGVRFVYSHWQLAEFALCLDLLDAGIPPSLIQTHLSDSGFYSMGGVGEGIESVPPVADGGIYFLVELNALNYLRTANPDAAGARVSDRTFKTRRVPSDVLHEITHKPSVVINVSKRLADLKSAVARALPDRRPDNFFLPPAARNGGDR